MSTVPPGSEQRCSGAAAVIRPGQVLAEELSRTLPLEVELLRLHQYKIELKNGAFPFVVLKLYIPEHKEQAVVRWQAAAEKTYGMKFFVQRERIYSGLKKQLEFMAAKELLLTERHGALITRVLDHFNGNAPTSAHLARHPVIPHYAADCTKLPFITIDSASTRGREDAVYAQACPGGGIRLYVAIVDICWLFEAGSYFDVYAQKLGASIYGSKRTVSTIGSELALGPASLMPGEERCAWIIEVFIRPGGQSLLSSAPYRARICVKEHWVPEALNALSAADNALPPALSVLARGCEALYRARSRPARLIRFKGEGTAEMIVAESMIAAKCWSARFLGSRSFAPAVYKVHSAPAGEERAQILQTLNDLGVAAVSRDFDDPLAFAEILAALQAQVLGGDGNGRREQASSVSDRILEQFLMRSRYDVRNLGHHGLGLDAYMDVKPRDASGITNQFQLLAALEDPAKALDAALIAARVRARNRKLARHDRMSFRLRFLEMLERKLSWVGETFEAAVVEDKGDHALADVTGFSKWGMIARNGVPFERGAALRVRLDGFCVDAMRFVFSPV